MEKQNSKTSKILIVMYENNSKVGKYFRVGEWNAGIWNAEHIRASHWLLNYSTLWPMEGLYFDSYIIGFCNSNIVFKKMLPRSSKC